MAVKSSHSNSFVQLFLLVVLAAVIRLFFMYTPAKSYFSERIELNTPLTSWKRVLEGIVLLDHEVSPYSGDIVHETPLVLALFYSLKHSSPHVIPLLFMSLDVLVGFILYQAAYYNSKILLKDQKKRRPKLAKNIGQILLTESDLMKTPLLTATVYLLNPYSIGSCVAQSTIIFTNLGLAFALYGTVKGNYGLSTLGVACAAYHSLYPIMLLVPVTLTLRKLNEGSAVYQSFKAVALCLFWLFALFGLSYQLFHSMDFLKATYGFILTVPDLTPNIGLFWYFFTEMFEHFRVFFLWVFQINAFFYCIPLTIRFREHPVFLFYVLCHIMCIMKSYPSFGDATVPLALLMMWKHLFPYMRNVFLIMCFMVFSTFLAPVFWYLWIYAGSANANFFYAITLVYSTAQILLASDILFAFLRRERDLVSGIFPKVMNGEIASVVFK